MVSDIYEPTKKKKATITAELKLKYSPKTQKASETTKDFTCLKTLQKDSMKYGNWQSSSTNHGLD